VIVQRQFVAVDLDIVAVIFLHQVHGHDVGHRHVGVCGVAEDVPGHHPPGHLHGLAVGVDELGPEGRIHHPVCIAGGICVQIDVICAVIRAGAHPLPDGRI